jgi:phytoene dehydrogenase-like protein
MTGFYDAIIIGSGPNGLAAAITLCRAGLSVLVLEAEQTAGGGVRSAELTLPGFIHDVCSAVHPLAVASPFFRTIPLAEYGLQWIHSPAPLAHPLDDGTAVVMERDVQETSFQLEGDSTAYRKLMGPLVRDWHELESDLLGPPRVPHYPIKTARFGWRAWRSGHGLAKTFFSSMRARALFAGLAAHSMLPLEQVPSAAFGLVLAITGHAVGWPIPQGGAQNIARALIAYLRSLGGKILLGVRVRSLDELPASRAVLCDLTPRQLLRLAGNRLPSSYQYRLQRYRYGFGVFKMDWAIDGPIPWRAAECLRATTVHLGGTLEEIATSERECGRGRIASRPFVLLAQPSLFDRTRAPSGRHCVWAYCHVPNGSAFDVTDRIEAQIERFAPGFRERIVARSIMSPQDVERHNANLVGGDINGGAANLRQLFLRPTVRLYTTPARGLYLCSASTPPGGGVHGMCGYFAARAALAREWKFDRMDGFVRRRRLFV